MTYSRILVGTDGSATANQAVAGGGRTGPPARRRTPRGHRLRASAPGMGTASGAVMATRRRRRTAGRSGQADLREGGRRLGRGTRHRGPRRTGAAADAIVETARSVGADLIVVGSKGMRGARRVLGSVPNSVAHGADSAVLIVKTGLTGAAPGGGGRPSARRPGGRASGWPGPRAKVGPLERHSGLACLRCAPPAPGAARSGAERTPAARRPGTGARPGPAPPPLRPRLRPNGLRDWPPTAAHVRA